MWPDSLSLSSLGNAHRGYLSAHTPFSRHLLPALTNQKVTQLFFLVSSTLSPYCSKYLTWVSVGRDKVIQSPHSCCIASITTPSWNLCTRSGCLAPSRRKGWA